MSAIERWAGSVRIASGGRFAALIVLGGIAIGCRVQVPPAAEPHAEEGHGEGAPTNRIAVPPEVVQSLGITFEAATRGRLGVWIRVPGRLEIPADRRLAIRAPAEGRIRLLVRSGDRVGAGAPLVAIESPALLEAQREIIAASSEAAAARDEAAAGASRLAEAEQNLVAAAAYRDRCDERSARLAELPGSSPLSNAERLEAERALVEARELTLAAAVRRDELRVRARALASDVGRAALELDRRLAALALLTGSSREALLAEADGRPAWQVLREIELRAPRAGIVASIAAAEGEHVAEGAPLLQVDDPTRLVFRGFLPESDLAAIRPGAETRIETPAAGTLRTVLWDAPPRLDEASRALVVEAWVENPSGALPHGLSATAQVAVGGGATEEVLLPETCLVRDGLETIVFRRDPAAPGVVIRTAVEVGIRSGGRAEILSGVLDGDEVVLAGVHQLARAGLGKGPEGGHFHADGTWHEGD